MEHFIELLSNPWVLITAVILLFGEYIPFTALLWQSIGAKLRTFGRWFLANYENRLYERIETPIETKEVQVKFNNFFARAFFFVISVIVIIFLEIFWELGFNTIRRQIEHTGWARWLQHKIEQMSAPWVLALFIAPFIIMEVLGVVAVIAFVAGHVWIGVAIYLFKVLLFIPVHFILHAGEAQLMSIAWFKRRYDIVTGVLDWFKSSQSFIKVHNITKTIKAYLNALKQRFKRTMQLLKKAFEHEEILPGDCETIRQQILRAQEQGDVSAELYEQFFTCMNAHLKAQQKDH